MLIKKVFIDVETTGTNHRQNGIIQIAGSVCFFTDSGVEEKENFNFNVAPFPSDRVEDQALEVNKVSKEQIAKYPMPNKVYRDFSNLIGKYCEKFNRQDKMFFVGYNARFDYDFMRSWFEKNGDNYFGSFFFFPPIDVMNLAIVDSIKQRHLLPNFKLGTVAEHYGIKAEGMLHDADVDIELTKRLYIELSGKDKDAIKFKNAVQANLAKVKEKLLSWSDAKDSSVYKCTQSRLHLLEQIINECK